MAKALCMLLKCTHYKRFQKLTKVKVKKKTLLPEENNKPQMTVEYKTFFIDKELETRMCRFIQQYKFQ